MKRFSIIVLGALAILMAGCSKDVHTAESGENDWVYDVNLPVPVQLGAGVFTKAAISSEAEMVGKPFGFFAVDKNASDLTADNGIELPDNARATCTVNEEGTKVEFQFVNGSNAKVSYYYPMMNNRYYSFYGYHAHQAGATDNPSYSKTSSRITVDFDFSRSNFQTDILHGMAAVSEPQQGNNGVMYDGFNAAYVRRVGKPMMNFKHATARVSLMATMAPDQEGKDGISIAQVGVYEVPTKASLCILDIENPELNGTFVTNNGVADESGNPRYTALPGSNIGILTTTTTTLSGDAFIAPQAEPLKIRVVYNVVRDGMAVNPQKEIIYEIDPSLYSSERHGFEAGYHYTFNLIFYSPEEIVIEATIEDYIDAFGGAVDVDPDNMGY